MKLKKFGVACCALVLLNAAAQGGEPRPEQVLEQMKRVAEWQLGKFKNGATPDWINATAFAGFAEMYHICQDEKFEEQLLALGERNKWDYERGLNNNLPYEGGLNNLPYLADHHCQGQFSLEMYAHKQDPKMLEAIQQRMDFVLANPPSCGLSHDAFGNKQRWNWCDALFMAPPVLMQLYALTGEKKYLDYMDQEFWATSDYLYSPKAQLMFRDDRFFNKKTTNGKSVFWGRGNGWVYGGLARILELYPKDRPAYKKYLKLYKEMTKGILSCRLESGLWPASLLDPEEVPGNEMSGSAFFCYGLAWGVNQGILDKKTYWPIALKAWNEMQGYVLDDGRYVGVQTVADDPKSFSNKGISAPYGTGAYLLAGSQVYQQLSGKKVNKRALYSSAARKLKAQSQ